MHPRDGLEGNPPMKRRDVENIIKTRDVCVFLGSARRMPEDWASDDRR